MEMNPTPLKKDHSVSMEQANLHSLAFAIPAVLVTGGLYVLRWGWQAFFTGFNALFGNFFIFLLVFIGGIVVHELIHGIAWMVFGRKPLNRIKFGFQVKTLTPYAHCTEPMEVNAYRLGTLMPGLLLGLIPAAYGILSGNGGWLAFGMLFSAAASGDALILWLLRAVKAGAQVEDHPSRAGCYVSEA